MFSGIHDPEHRFHTVTFLQIFFNTTSFQNNQIRIPSQPGHIMAVHSECAPVKPSLCSSVGFCRQFCQFFIFFSVQRVEKFCIETFLSCHNPQEQWCFFWNGDFLNHVCDVKMIAFYQRSLAGLSSPESDFQTLRLWFLPEDKNYRYHTCSKTCHLLPQVGVNSTHVSTWTWRSICRLATSLRYSRSSGIPVRKGADSQAAPSDLCSCHRAGAGKYSAHLKAQRSSSLAYLTFYHILRPQHSSHSDTLLFSKEFQQCPHSLQFHYLQHCLQFLNQSLLFHNPSPLPLGKDTP